MSYLKISSLYALLALLSVGCMPQEQQGFLSDANRDEFKQKGVEVLAPLKKNLMQALMAELEESAHSAVEVCQLEAPEITQQAQSSADTVEVAGQDYRVSLGRSSHKTRNPKNAPKKWMREYIESFAGQKDFSPDEKAVVIQASPASVGYLEPIPTGPLCMTCHGDAVDRELEDFIVEKYPADQATGFSVGEFRGVFWVEFIRE